jgi:hypothetical protein
VSAASWVGEFTAFSSLASTTSSVGFRSAQIGSRRIEIQTDGAVPKTLRDDSQQRPTSVFSTRFCQIEPIAMIASDWPGSTTSSWARYPGITGRNGDVCWPVELIGTVNLNLWNLP